MKEELSAIQKLLVANSSAEAKTANQKFVPGKEKVYGVRMPYLNEIATEYKIGGFELVESLWNAGALEEKILAVKMLGKIAKKDTERSFQLVQFFAENIGNWAVCDAIGMQALKPLLKTHRQQIFALAKTYNRSQIFWQRRLSLVLVEWYTRFPDLHPEIKKLITPLKNDQEYYVKKAVTWINRNLEKGK